MDAEAVVAQFVMQQVGGGQRENVFKHRLRLGHIAQREEGIDGLDVRLGSDVLALEDGLHLAAEEELAVLMVVVERLLAAAVAGDDELLLVHVIKAESEHAVHALEQAHDAPLFIAVDDALGVAVRGEDVAGGF